MLFFGFNPEADHPLRLTVVIGRVKSWSPVVTCITVFLLQVVKDEQLPRVPVARADVEAAESQSNHGIVIIH